MIKESSGDGAGSTSHLGLLQSPMVTTPLKQILIYSINAQGSISKMAAVASWRQICPFIKACENLVVSRSIMIDIPAASNWREVK